MGEDRRPSECCSPFPKITHSHEMLGVEMWKDRFQTKEALPVSFRPVIVGSIDLRRVIVEERTVSPKIEISRLLGFLLEEDPF